MSSDSADDLDAQIAALLEGQPLAPNGIETDYDAFLREITAETGAVPETVAMPEAVPVASARDRSQKNRRKEEEEIIEI